MKSVILRCFMTFRNPMALAVCLVFLCMPVFMIFQLNEETNTVSDIFMMNMMISMMGCIMVMSVLADDEKNGWDKFMATTPVPRKKIILGKYIYTAVFALIFNLASSVPVIALMLKQDAFDMKELLFVISVTLLITVFTISLSTPVSVRFGFLAGMAVYVIVFMTVLFGGVIISAVMGKSEAGITALNEMIHTDKYVLSAVFFGSAVIIFCLSALISAAVFKRKEF